MSVVFLEVYFAFSRTSSFGENAYVISKSQRPSESVEDTELIWKPFLPPENNALGLVTCQLVCQGTLCCMLNRGSKSTESQNVGGWKGPLGPRPTPCQSSVPQSRLHRTMSRQVLNISREGDSTTSLGSLCQGSVTLRGKKFFLLFSWNFLCFMAHCKLLILLVNLMELYFMDLFKMCFEGFFWHTAFLIGLWCQVQWLCG